MQIGMLGPFEVRTDDGAANVRAVVQDLLGYLAEDLGQARDFRMAAFQAASEAGLAPMIAQVLVGIADLALRYEQYEQAARLLAASASVRDPKDQSQPDVTRIEQVAWRRLGDTKVHRGDAGGGAGESA